MPLVSQIKAKCASFGYAYSLKHSSSETKIVRSLWRHLELALLMISRQDELTWETSNHFFAINYSGSPTTDKYQSHFHSQTLSWIISLLSGSFLLSKRKAEDIGSTLTFLFPTGHSGMGLHFAEDPFNSMEKLDFPDSGGASINEQLGNITIHD